MIRITIRIAQDNKQWLEQKAIEEEVSVSEVIRCAVRRLRKEEDDSFERLLKLTSGTLRKGGGLKYQRRIRREWR